MRLLFATLAAALALSGGEPASTVVRGRVTDPSGAVVPAAVLRLAPRGGGPSRQTTTGLDGAFRFGDVPPGWYELSVESPGFAPYQRGSLEIGGPALELEIGMRLSPMAAAVTVTAKAPPAEAVLETSPRNSREVLEIREVRESAAKDVGEAVANLEGVWKIRKAGIANDIVLRGFQQGNINVVVDGEHVYGACPNHMDPAASHVDFAEVASVEVVKGPFNVRDQGSLGGAVRIVSRQPGEGLRLTPNLAAGSFGFYNPSLVASAGNERWYGLAGYSYRRSDAYRDGAGHPVTSYAGYTPAGAANSAFDIHTAWGRLGARLGNQTVTLSYTHQAGGLTLYPALQMDALYDNADRIGLAWSLRELPGAVKELHAEGYFSRVKHWMTDELRTSGTGKPLGYSMGTFAGTRAAGGRVEAGLPHTLVGVEAYDRGWNATGSLLAMGVYSAQPTMPAVRMLSSGLYAQHTRTPGRWNLSFGGRVDAANSAARAHNLDTGLFWAYWGTRATSAFDAAVSGNARATYMLRPGLELFAGVGSSMRLPDPEERYFAFRRMGSDWLGNPALEPTRNTETDFGIHLRTRVFSLRPTVFWSRLADYIALVPRTRIYDVPGVVNSIARSYLGVPARMAGGELSWSVAATRSLLVAGGVSYTRGEQLALPEAGVGRTALAEIPPLKSRASLRYGTGLFFAEVNGLASAAQHRVNLPLREQPTSGYALMGFRGGIHRGRLNFALGVDNALDRYYIEHLSFQRDPYRTGVRIPEPGRTVYVNVSFATGGAR